MRLLVKRLDTSCPEDPKHHVYSVSFWNNRSEWHMVECHECGKRTAKRRFLQSALEAWEKNKSKAKYYSEEAA